MSLCVAVMFVVLPALAGGRAGVSVGVEDGGGEGGEGAAFARRQQTSVLARVGEAAALRCRVLRLADRTVSWVRSSDLQILAHAGAVFTADARVSCVEEPWDAGGDGPGTDDLLEGEEDWGPAGSVHTLRIDGLRLSDAGRYECQVNTEPKLSTFFNLTIIEDAVPSVVVRAVSAGGGRSAALQLGGSARLTCEARYEPALGPDALAGLPPLRIRWEHDGQILDPQSSRGGISLDTDRWAGRLVSRLTLARLAPSDGGRYACVAGAARAYHQLRLAGDPPPAGDPPEYDAFDGELESMQRDQAAARTGAAQRSTRPLHAALSLLLLMLLLRVT